MDALDFALRGHRGNMLLASMEATLLALKHSNAIVSRENRRQYLERLEQQHKSLVGYLRNSDHDAPNWDAYPLARNYFTQN